MLVTRLRVFMVALNVSTLALSALYTAMNGARWQHNQGWLSITKSAGACPAWAGVLACSKRGAAGTTTGPTRIALSGPFVGTLPTQIGALSTLRDFELSSNTRQLSGTLPTQLGALSALQEFKLSGRAPRLSGTLPEGLGRTALDVLLIRTSRLSGTLPIGIGSRSRCAWWPGPTDPATGVPGDGKAFPLLAGSSECHFNTWLRLPHNSLSGTLPRTVTELPLPLPTANGTAADGGLASMVAVGRRMAVGELDLQHNALSGTIPPSLSGTHKLKLGGNPRLSGSVPAAITSSLATWTLSLDGTQVAGARTQALSDVLASDGLPLAGWSRISQAVADNASLPHLQRLLAILPHDELNTLSWDGRAPLHYTALITDMHAHAAALLSAGAAAHFTSRSGETTVDMARRFGRPRLAALLALSPPRSAQRSTANGPAATYSGSPRRPLFHRALPKPLQLIANWRVAVRSSNLTGRPSAGSSVAAAPKETARGEEAPTSCCLNSCRGRGACVLGLCLCDPPYEGVDCGVHHLPMPHHGSSSMRSGTSNGGGSSRGGRPGTSGRELPAACPRGGRHGIYLGDDGLASFAAGLPSGCVPGACVAHCMSSVIRTLDPAQAGIYAPIDTFLVRLLNDLHFRAPSPECAAATWHPTYGLRLTGNVNSHVSWQLHARLAASRLPSSAHALLPRIHEHHLDRGPCEAPVAAWPWPGDIVLRCASHASPK